MGEKVKINIYSSNKQNIRRTSDKCMKSLKNGDKVILTAKSSAIPKAISVSEIIKLEIPNIVQFNSLFNLEDKSKERRKNITMVIELILNDVSSEI
ncbi:DNA/RNA-binding protein Alba-like protein [Cryptosporidium felis]|nr:DNA/RNA-binding protein Alba-like protein [Cryptosporidium felis]